MSQTAGMAGQLPRAVAYPPVLPLMHPALRGLCKPSQNLAIGLTAGMKRANNFFLPSYSNSPRPHSSNPLHQQPRVLYQQIVFVCVYVYYIKG